MKLFSRFKNHVLEFGEKCSDFIYLKEFQFLFLIKGYDDKAVNSKRLVLSLKQTKYI